VHLLAPTSGCSAIGVDETQMPEIEIFMNVRMYACMYVYVQQSIYHFGTKKKQTRNIDFQCRHLPQINTAKMAKRPALRIM